MLCRTSLKCWGKACARRAAGVLCNNQPVCSPSPWRCTFWAPKYFKLWQMLNWYSAGFQSREVKTSPLLHVQDSRQCGPDFGLFSNTILPDPATSSSYLQLKVSHQPLPLSTFSFLKRWSHITRKNPHCGRVSRLSCALAGGGDELASSARAGSCRTPASSPLEKREKKRAVSRSHLIAV